MKISRIVKLIIVIVGITYLIQNPSKVAEGKVWVGNQVQQWVALFDTNTSLPNNQVSAEPGTVNTTTDHQDATHLNGAVWAKKTLNVYFDVAADQQPAYLQAWQQAFNNWNDVQVLTLVQVQNKNQADIVLTTENRGDTSQAGVAETRFLVNPVTGKKVMTHVVAKLNTHYLDDYTMARKINTAEHELGHALGLDHVSNRVSVMQPQGSDYGIQQSDVSQLQALYAH